MSWLSSLPSGEDRTIGTSEWMTVSQARIDCFADATNDYQFIHVDPKRAAREAPFGGTIAHGMLTLSLVSTLAAQVLPPSDDLQSVFVVAIDRVKFVTPLQSGKRVRGVFTLDRTLEMAKDRLLLKVGASVEIEGEGKPALTCEVSWIAVFKSPHAVPVARSGFDASVG